jgi:glutathione S-transferase
MKYLGLDFDEIMVPLFQGNFKEELFKHSASGKVPVLKTGEFEVWDSLAICEFLNDTYPQAKLWPKDAHAKAIARSISCEMHSGFFTIRNDMSMNMRRVIEGFTPSKNCQIEIDRVKDIWIKCRAEFGAEGGFLFGHFTIADAMYAPIISRFTSYQIPMEGTVKDYAQTVLNLPMMKEWAAEAQLEEWVIEGAEYK